VSTAALRVVCVGARAIYSLDIHEERIRMAVGIRLKFDGGTQENYDAAHAVMEVDTDPPAGMIVHSAGPIEGGWGVVDFWESRDAFDTFVDQRLMPRLQGLGDRGFPNPPDVKQFEVHNLEMP
jgi:hypothetical protein